MSFAKPIVKESRYSVNTMVVKAPVETFLGSLGGKHRGKIKYVNFLIWYAKIIANSFDLHFVEYIDIHWCTKFYIASFYVTTSRKLYIMLKKHNINQDYTKNIANICQKNCSIIAL